MKLITRLLPILGMYIILTSSVCIVKPIVPVANGETITAPGKVIKLKKHKLNFFQRFIVKLYLKKHKLLEDNQADKLASTSLWLGIGACAALLLGLFIPYIILAAIPLGIAAMITGGAAIRDKTSLVGKARTGKGLGLGALIAFGVLLIAALIIVAAWVSGI
ncbi:MAG: hypothetical protein ABI683_15360 [Ginsengibacter sp.]